MVGSDLAHYSFVDGKLRCTSVPEYCFYLRNSADPDEMQHYAAVYLGLHRLSKYSFRSFQYIKGQGKSEYDQEFEKSQVITYFLS